MLNTYKAILKGDRLEWSGEAPELPPEGRPVAVHVTILDEEGALVPKHLSQGQRMAAALEQLAATQALADIADPVAWEREVRQDRTLPDRDL